MPVNRMARWRPLPFDVLLAVLLLGVGQWQIHSPDSHRVIPHPGLSAVIWVVTASALVWRRRFRWQAFTIVVVGVTVEALPAPDSGTLAGFVALCVVLYTVVRAESRIEKTVVATAIAVLALLFHYARDPRASNAVESIQATYVVLLACPVVARLIAGRAARTELLESELAIQHERQAEAAQAAVTAERARIARELHDVIAHSVSVTIVQSMAAQTAIIDGHLADARRRLGSIEEAARNALADMRRLVTIDDTDPPTTLEAQPRMATLHQLVQRLTDSGTEVHLDQQGPWTDVPLGTDLALFRITQEAVTNAINHAPGAAIHIRVVDRDGFVATDITNGTATRPDPGPGSGRGLLGMRERVQLYGGTLQTGPRPDGGYQVHAALPTTAATR
jgi:signal transduction histidine kinase